MRILVACEFSGTVRRAFQEAGYDAWSCDLLPAQDGSRQHIQGDVLELLNDGWDMVIAFPPCTHLAVSGARHFAAKRADGRQAAAAEFFMRMVEAPAPFVAVENPVGIMSTIYRPPDQYVSPHWFGHAVRKRTGLWLKGLPNLVPTCMVDPITVKLGDGSVYSEWEYRISSDKKNRGMRRSVTFQGLADAMVAQWAPALERGPEGAQKE